VHSLFPHSLNPMRRQTDMTREKSGVGPMALHAFRDTGVKRFYSSSTCIRRGRQYCLAAQSECSRFLGTHKGIASVLPSSNEPCAIVCIVKHGESQAILCGAYIQVNLGYRSPFRYKHNKQRMKLARTKAQKFEKLFLSLSQADSDTHRTENEMKHDSRIKTFLVLPSVK
ncbi:hypothetical protein SFRURICE_013534, partial [Spodoptera frugiperda]